MYGWLSQGERRLPGPAGFPDALETAAVGN